MTNKPFATDDLNFVLEQTRPLWDELRNKRLFITGGTGFFGTWLLSTFLHINKKLTLHAEVSVLTRYPERFRTQSPHLASDPSVTMVSGDIRSFQIPPGEFEFVIHAATEVSTITKNSNPIERYTAITEGTAHMLEFAATHATKKFLLTSSGAVYGVQPTDLSNVSEEFLGAPDVLSPNSAYGEGKRASELMCALYAKQSSIEFKIARCFAFVGPNLPLDSNFAVGNFIRDAIKGSPIQIGGDGTPLRSYLYAADLAVWLWTILFKAPTLRPFNVGSDEAISIAELARLTADTLNPSLPISIAQHPKEGVAPTRYVPATQRVQHELGLSQHYSLAESIERTAVWYSS